MKVLSEVDGRKTKVPIKLFTDPNSVEPEALQQLFNISQLPTVHGISVMPDVHLGKGATVGSVIATNGIIAPSAVGVDIGCVDKDSEFLSPTGWIKISDYKEGMQVLQYNPETNLSFFRAPNAYIKLPCDEFYHIKTKYGIDQMLSEEHRVWYEKHQKAGWIGNYDFIEAKDLANKHDNTKLGFRGKFKTSFGLDSGLELGDSVEDIRVMVMVIADGYFKSKTTKSNMCTLHVKKVRKLDRAKRLLSDARIEYKVNPQKDGTFNIVFRAPYIEKSFGRRWWNCSANELSVVASECLYWDGNLDDRVFFTRDKHSADFIQYAATISGHRSVLRSDKHKKDGKLDYRVFMHSPKNIGIAGSPKSAIKKVPSEDGFKYCFTVPTGLWVMRRGSNIVVTGNCGMLTVPLNKKMDDLNKQDLFDKASATVPVGFKSHEGIVKHASEVDKHFLTASERVKSVLSDKTYNQIGTLGAGNHFIEFCADEEGNAFLMLHSGSRNIGKVMADIHIKKAKEIARIYHIPLEDPDLAYLAEETPEFAHYIEDLEWCQRYAYLNRQQMLDNIMRAIGIAYKQSDVINCHHNYMAKENHYGKNVLVVRKGAIRAREGDLGIIPGSMGQRSYIVKGKGNRDSMCSCSHGAGRVHSRTKAKKLFTVDDLVEQTKDVICRKDEGVLDEIPSAYKNIDEVMAHQSSLVDIMKTLKAEVCIKG